MLELNVHSNCNMVEDSKVNMRDKIEKSWKLIFILFWSLLTEVQRHIIHIIIDLKEIYFIFNSNAKIDHKDFLNLCMLSDKSCIIINGEEWPGDQV